MPKAQATKSAPAFAYPGIAWMEMMHTGTMAWAQASAELAKTMADVGAAQAKSFGALSSGGGAPSAWPWLDPNALFRSELVLAEIQAERTAEALRQTLSDTASPTSPGAPFPLPD